jgi:hypothetical protein
MNSNPEWFLQALRAQIPHLPVVMVCLVAITIAIVKWRQAPLAALLCTLGFGIIIGLSTVMPFVQYFLLMGPARPAGGAVSVWMTILSVIWSGLVAVAYVLLAVAVFAGRSKPPQA